jgi:aspartate 1-decarboxylase
MTVTQSDLDYEGSLALDIDFLEAVNILPYEKLLVANLNNGNRFETYAIPAPRGSRTVCLNGAASHKGKVGDRITVFTFALLSSDEIATHRPLILGFDANNQRHPNLKVVSP